MKTAIYYRAGNGLGSAHHFEKVEENMSIFYDAQEIANEAAATRQIDYDQRCFEAALHDAVMTCTDAGDTRLDDYLPLICSANGLQYPPRQHDSTLFTLHTKAQNEHSLHGTWAKRNRENSQSAQLQPG